MRTCRRALLCFLGLAIGCGSSALGQTPAGTAFTYQGRLTSGGTPAAGLYDVQFKLFSASALGSQVGSTVCADGIAPNPDGTFTTLLDFGTVASGAALWIELSVRADSTAGNCGSGAYTMLSPRQQLTPAPYAMGVSLPLSESQAVDVFGGAAFKVTNLSALNATYGVQGQSNSNAADSAGVYGVSSGTTGSVSGVKGLTSSPNGYGVWGIASSSISGTSGVGVFGLSSGSAGTAVFAHESAATGYTYGVQAFADSSNAVGVTGVAGSLSGSTVGVLGTSSSDEGTGVKGIAYGTTGNNTGVYGETDSADGIAVSAYSRSLTGAPIGVYSNTEAPDAIAVYAHCDATSGTSVGVIASVNSPDGIPIQGDHAASTGTLPAVRGGTQSTSSYTSAVAGTVYPTSPGGYSAGVLGVNNGTGGNGVGVWGTQNGSGWGVYGTTPGGAGVRGEATDTTSINYGVYGTTASTNGYAGYFAQKVFVGGDLKHKFTAAGAEQRMTPIAYGYVNASGTLVQATSNVSASFSGGLYFITIVGESYFYQNYVTIVTPTTDSTPVVATTGSGAGILQVHLFSLTGAATTGDFHFVVFKR